MSPIPPITFPPPSLDCIPAPPVELRDDRKPGVTPPHLRWHPRELPLYNACFHGHFQRDRAMSNSPWTTRSTSSHNSPDCPHTLGACVPQARVRMGFPHSWSNHQRITREALRVDNRRHASPLRPRSLGNALDSPPRSVLIFHDRDSGTRWWLYSMTHVSITIMRSYPLTRVQRCSLTAFILLSGPIAFVLSYSPDVITILMPYQLTHRLCYYLTLLLSNSSSL